MKLTLEKKTAHGGDPVMRWMADNIFRFSDIQNYFINCTAFS